MICGANKLISVTTAHSPINSQTTAAVRVFETIAGFRPHPLWGR